MSEGNTTTEKNTAADIDISVLDRINDDEDEHMQVPHTRSIIFMASVFVLLNICAVIYVRLSRTMYYWGTSEYWELAKTLATRTSGGFFSEIYRSINQDGANYLAAFLPSVTAKVFTQSRMGYILTITDLYLFPMLIALYILVKKHTKNPILMTILLLLFCPLPVYLTLSGCVDAGAAALVFTAYILYFDKFKSEDFHFRLRKKHVKTNSRGEWKRYVKIGLLLGAAVLFRRQFIYFTVSFIITMLAEYIIFGGRIRNVIITAVSALVPLCCFPGFLATIGAEAGIAADCSLSGFLSAFTGGFGMVLILTAAVSSVYIFTKKHDRRVVTLWVQTLLCALMLEISAGHEIYNIMLYIPPMLMLIIIFLGHIQEPIKRELQMYPTRQRSVKSSGTASKNAVVLWLCFAALSTAMSVTNESSTERTLSFYPKYSMCAPSRDDITELLELKKYINTTVGDDETVGVLAASDTFNADILKNVGCSLGITDRDSSFITQLPVSDTGNWHEYYAYDYVVVAYPIQKHPKTAEQNHFSQAHTSFERYADIAIAYSDTGESFTLADGVEVRVYKKTAEPTAVEIADFRQRL